jgi:ferredoxin
VTTTIEQVFGEHAEWTERDRLLADLLDLTRRVEAEERRHQLTSSFVTAFDMPARMIDTCKGCIVCGPPKPECVDERDREIARLRAQVRKLDAEVTRLCAGADDTPQQDPAGWPTPGQMWHRLIEADESTRTAWLARMIEDAQVRSRCFTENHEARITALEQAAERERKAHEAELAAAYAEPAGTVRRAAMDRPARMSVETRPRCGVLYACDSSPCRQPRGHVNEGIPHRCYDPYGRGTWIDFLPPDAFPSPEAMEGLPRNCDVSGRTVWVEVDRSPELRA